MKVLITGSRGFIGQNLLQFLKLKSGIDILEYNHKDKVEKLKKIIQNADFIFHLAGINRTYKKRNYLQSNYELTKKICNFATNSKKNIPILFSSSRQVLLDNAYGESKKKAERVLLSYKRKTGAQVYIYRLPNVFGKWCKPNYNSVVATFCYNISRNLPIKINDSSAKLNLVYIDDVIESFCKILDKKYTNKKFFKVYPIYKTTVGKLVEYIKNFKNIRKTLLVDKVGSGFFRALYSTYISFLPKKHFSYPLSNFSDDRGSFVEVLKTKNSGQFSFFTANKGCKRGGHFHHSKTEKFLVLQGKARFCFKHLVTNKKYKLIFSDKVPTIVESIPGWSHDITNIGNNKLIVMLWSNEIFDIKKPDTYENPV